MPFQFNEHKENIIKTRDVIGVLIKEARLKNPNNVGNIEKLSICFQLLSEVIANESSINFYDKYATHVKHKYKLEILKILSINMLAETNIDKLFFILSCIIREAYLSGIGNESPLTETKYIDVTNKFIKFNQIQVEREYFLYELPILALEKKLEETKNILSKGNQKINENSLQFAQVLEQKQTDVDSTIKKLDNKIKDALDLESRVNNAFGRSFFSMYLIC